MHEKAADELQATFNADLAALEIWLDVQRAHAMPASADESQRSALPSSKVLDFDLVKSIDGVASDTVTMDLSIIGAPHYMPPEAIVAPDEVDRRSDLYAVGAVGYFLVTGQNAFHGQSVIDVCQMHLNVAPETPSMRTPLPVLPELETVLLLCLEKRKDARPQSAVELTDQLA